MEELLRDPRLVDVPSHPRREGAADTLVVLFHSFKSSPAKLDSVRLALDAALSEPNNVDPGGAHRPTSITTFHGSAQANSRSPIRMAK